MVRRSDDKIEATVGETTVPAVENHSPPISSTASEERDDNYDLYKQTRDVGFTPEEAKKVLRKIDLQILPVLIVTYTLQYLDKNSINYAAVYGLKQGTGLKGQDYSWLSAFRYFSSNFIHLSFQKFHLSNRSISSTGSIFYFGYLVAQYPAGYALQRLPTGKVLSITTLSEIPMSLDRH